ncbi:MAG: nitroreductase/quinone reductase family protein [Actinomycetota bacterium]|nr:nitroreductase/quinone reductase family protein [Actinomycetota bacterium]
MEQEIQRALETDRTIDITTTGRYTGELRRTEIWFHNVDGEIYITGMPGPRSWYANLMSNAAFTFHLKETIERDLPAMAIPVVDKTRRRRILSILTERMQSTVDLDDWVAGSPLVEVRL